jgi:hypothetical protein
VIHLQTGSESLHNSKIVQDPKTESTKLQIPNNKQITMTKIPNPKLVSSGTTALNSVSVIEYWDLGFICNLVLGIWDFLV